MALLAFIVFLVLIVSQLSSEGHLEPLDVPNCPFKCPLLVCPVLTSPRSHLSTCIVVVNFVFICIYLRDWFRECHFMHGVNWSHHHGNLSHLYLCYTKHHIYPFSLYISAAGMDSLIPGLDPLQTDPVSAALPGQQFCKCDSLLNHTAAHWSTESADIRLGKSAWCSEWHNYCQLWTSVAAQ